MEFADAIQDHTIEAPPPSPPPERETFMHLVEDSVSDEESTAQKDRLVEVDNKILRVEAEKAGAVSDYNKDLKQLRKERIAILEVIGSGKVRRQIACYEERDERRGHMLVRRVDTDEVVDERPLSVSERDERQGDLFDGAAPTDDRSPADVVKDAEDSGRLIRTTSAAARQRRADRELAEAAGDPDGDLPDEEAPDSDDAPDSASSYEEGGDIP